MTKKLIIIFLLAIIFDPISIFAATCSETLKKMHGFSELSHLGVKVNQEKQNDFSNVRTSSDCYLEVWPKTKEEVAKIVAIAYKNNILIRTQGNAHSQNASALPKNSEILIHTSMLNRVQFKKLGTVNVGSGVPIFLLYLTLDFYEYGSIPIYNAGDIGPSIGGFISAGGIGKQSRVFGGFWENVLEITVVTGYGKILHISKNDPLFPWMFGSMGQFGIITDATLKLYPLDSTKEESMKNYPLGFETNLLSREFSGARFAKRPRRMPMYWFNLFVKPNQVPEAEEALKQLQKKYSSLLAFAPFYYWPVKHYSIVPPLVYPNAEDFVTVGISGFPTTKEFNNELLLQLEKDFADLCSKNHYKRYIQTELSNTPTTYQKYFGNDIYEHFKKLKLEQDPKHLFNHGDVFTD